MSRNARDRSSSDSPLRASRERVLCSIHDEEGRIGLNQVILDTEQVGIGPGCGPFGNLNLV